MKPDNAGPPTDKFPYAKVSQQVYDTLEETLNVKTAAFSGYTDDYGWEPWAFDGQSVAMIADLVEGPDSSQPLYFELLDGDLYMTANESSLSFYDAVYRVDGETGGVTTYDISPDSSEYAAISQAFGDIYVSTWNFDAGFSEPETGIAKIETSDDTVSVIESGGINPAVGAEFVEVPEVGAAYFAATDAEGNFGLGTIDGETGTVGFVPTPGLEPSVQTLAYVNGDIYFAAKHYISTSSFYNQFVKHDPATGTTEVIDRMGDDAYTFADGKFYYEGYEPGTGAELHRYDVSADTVDVYDTTPGSDSTDVYGIVVSGDDIIFRGANYLSETFGNVYHVDAATGDTTFIFDSNGDQTGFANGAPMVEYQGDVYLGGYTEETGYELFKVDLETLDYGVVADHVAGADSSYMEPIGEVNGTLALRWDDPDVQSSYQFASYDGSTITEHNEIDSYAWYSMDIVDGDFMVA